MIPKDKFYQLVAQFKREDDSGSYEQRRAEWWSHFTFDITPEWIEALSEEDALRLYKNTGWGVKLYHHTFLENGIDSIKASLMYLLYSNDPPEERFFNVVDSEGSHKLGGVGREFASFLLCTHDNQRYGIWNTPVDEGLRLLQMTPRRQRGEHIGQTYAKVVERLKELQTLGGFADLQFVDEFLELVAKGFVGRQVLGQGEAAPIPEEAPSVAEEAMTQHTKMQWLLIEIGLLEGYDVWVATGDKGKGYQGQSFAEVCLAELPHFAGPSVMDVAQHIDVIWFKRGTASPARFFEIEHSTSIYSGLLRMNDVIIDYPLPEAVIVASVERRPHFEAQVGRRTFNVSGLAEVCRFMAYEDVEKLREVELVREQLL